MNKNYVIILASGVGSRTHLSIPKQFYEIEGKSLLEHTLQVFEQHPEIHFIIVVTHSDYFSMTQSIVGQIPNTKVIKILVGGKTRQESSAIAIRAIEDLNVNTKILIHDAARPFVSYNIIKNCIQALDIYDAIGVGIPLEDTIVKKDKDNYIVDVPERSQLLRMQTPQGFKLKLIKKAHNLAREREDSLENITDDCGLIIKYNLAPVHIIQGEDRNMKITTALDITVAKNLFILLKNIEE